jgi:AraC-like DNA-binding protein
LKRTIKIGVNLCVTLLVCWAESNAQIRIEVVRHPKFTLKESDIFISGTFNSWSPGDENSKLSRGSNGVYFFELPDTLSYFEYKFTQGNWAMVEGTPDGKVRANRVYNRNIESNPKLVQVEIDGWETLPSLVLVVKKVPKNTPHDASIYVMGNFNNWNPEDKSYKLVKQIDGSYRTLFVYSQYPQVQFKFTRGTIESVESRPGGRLLPNRTIALSDIKINSDVEVEIYSWQDISEPNQLYSIYDLLLFFSFFQCILLIFTTSRAQGYNRAATRWLLGMLGFTSFILLLKVISNSAMLIEAAPKLQLLPDFVFFVYAPLFYYYIKRLLYQSRTTSALGNKFHFIPSLIQFFIYSAYFFIDASTFKSKLATPYSDLYYVRFGLGCAGLIFSLFYWLSSYKALKMYKENYENNNSYEQNLQYLGNALFIQAICLIAWASIVVIAAIGWMFKIDIFNIVEFSTETIWIIFALIPFFLGHFAIYEPDVFRVAEVIHLPQPSPIPLTEGLEKEKMELIEKVDEPIENLEVEMKKVITYMEQEKPYTNPKLNLVELAHHLKMPPYVLSKIINAGFDKNFFDFINGYRVNEFKRRVEDPQFRNYTLLSIAFDVGFNSKTAFNRSFKKITNQTPSSFFKNRTEY